jgi:hypothetical protein
MQISLLIVNLCTLNSISRFLSQNGLFFDPPSQMILIVLIVLIVLMILMILINRSMMLQWCTIVRYVRCSVAQSSLRSRHYACIEFDYELSHENTILVGYQIWNIMLLDEERRDMSNLVHGLFFHLGFNNESCIALMIMIIMIRMMRMIIRMIIRMKMWYIVHVTDK